jgi:hypothetical protein
MLWQLVEVMNFDDEVNLAPAILSWLHDHFHEAVRC